MSGQEIGVWTLDDAQDPTRRKVGLVEGDRVIYALTPETARELAKLLVKAADDAQATT